MLLEKEGHSNDDDDEDDGCSPAITTTATISVGMVEFVVRHKFTHQEQTINKHRERERERRCYAMR